MKKLARPILRFEEERQDGIIVYWFRFVALVVVAVLGACCPAVMNADDSAGVCEIQQVSLGLAGHFQVGTWTPASMTIVARKGAPATAHLTTIVSDCDGQLVSTHGQETPLEIGRPVIVHGRFFPGKLTGDITLKLISGQKTLCERKIRVGFESPSQEYESFLRPGLKHDTPVWGLLGVRGLLIEDALPSANSVKDTGTRDHPVPTLIELKPSSLPSDSIDWDALDVLVFSPNATSDDGHTVLSELTSRQYEALREWIQVRGGHLILCLGSQLAEFQKSPLNRWLSLPLESEISVRQLDGLETYAPHTAKLKFAGVIPSIRIGSSMGTTLARGLDGPLLIQVPSGFGRVSFLAVDAHRPPLSSWPAFGYLLEKLTRVEKDQIRQVRIQGAQLAKSGTNDLSTQWYAALEEFPQVTRLSLLAVMFLMALYIIIVGPIDYLIVHSWLQRPHLTWITFPAWIVLGTLAIAGLSNWLNGTHSSSHQVDIVDYDLASGLLRGKSWFSFYSPNTTRRAIRFDSTRAQTWARSGTATPPDAIRSTEMTWLAPAESRVGGLYRDSGMQLTTRSYQFTTMPGTASNDSSNAGRRLSTEYGDYPFQVWSTGRFGASWFEQPEPLVEVQLSSRGYGRVTGSIMHSLPVPLEDCLLAYANYVYFPVLRIRGEKSSALPPDFNWEIGRGRPVETRDLRSFLTQLYTRVKEGRTQNTAEVLDISTPYDASRRDFPYIMRMISFHEAAGGRDYTGLRNDVLESLDFSQHLRLGRAVLFGRMERASSTWTADGTSAFNTTAQTFVRFILPVNRDQEGTVEVLPNDEAIKTLVK